MKKQYYFLISIFISSIAFGQPNIEWQESMGGSARDVAWSITHTNDGGYIVAATTESSDGDVSANHGAEDIWIVKLSVIGGIEWEHTYGGTGHETGRVIRQTSDGGYVFCASSDSNDGDVSGNNGTYDFWVVKLDVNGNIEWEDSFGGSDSEAAYSIEQTTDGGFIVVGESASNDGDVIGNVGATDIWVIKLDPQGQIEWQNSLGGSDFEFAIDVLQLSTGEYAVFGSTGSSDGDVSAHDGQYDYWLILLSTQGVLQWEKTFGGTNWDQAASLIQTSDGGLMLSGHSGSNDGDITNNNGSWDYWVVKTDIDGNIQWENAFGGSDVEQGGEIWQTSDGGFVMTGTSRSNDGDVTGNNGGSGDTWVIRIDNVGALLWQKAMGGSNIDGSSGIIPTSDGGYIVAGASESNDGDVTGNHGEFDAWIIKLSPDPTTILEIVGNNEFQLFPNPASTDLFVEIMGCYVGQIEYEVLDHSGRSIISGTSDHSTFGEYSFKVPVGKIRSGVYHLRLMDGESTYVEQFIKL